MRCAVSLVMATRASSSEWRQVPIALVEACSEALAIASDVAERNGFRAPEPTASPKLSRAVSVVLDEYVKWRGRPPVVRVECRECRGPIDRWRIARDGTVRPAGKPRPDTEKGWEGLPFASRANAGKGRLIATRAAGTDWRGTYDYRCDSCRRRDVASVTPARRLKLCLEAMKKGTMVALI
jgi:hypothetical protein